MELQQKREEKKSESKHLDFFSMIESVPANIFYADSELYIRYVNRQAQQTMGTIAGQVRSTFGVDPNNLVGVNIDTFHGGRVQEIRNILANLGNMAYETEINLAELILKLNINKVTSATGEAKGYVVYWEEISEKKDLEERASRAMSMLDQSPINTMFSNIEGDLLYMNEQSRKTLLEIEKDLPDRVANLVGQKIDIFHKDPEHQRKMIRNVNNLPHKAQIKVGENILALLVSPVRNANGDYLGPMVTWEVITDRVELVESLTETSENLSKAAGQLANLSQSMAASAEETASQSNTVAANSEEVTSGVQSVATNMEEMSASIKEITRSTNESSTKSSDAMKTAKETNEIILKLSDSSKDIGDVIKVINSIAQQTNLLALNATIEAARAGEAGKGFAVVAHEVKELARQTANATEDITKRINNIQQDSDSAVTAISEITDAIHNLNSIASNIAASVEEQSASTNEVTRVINESAESVKSISVNISQVSEAASETGKGAQDTQSEAENLKGISEKLMELVKKIKV